MFNISDGGASSETVSPKDNGAREMFRFNPRQITEAIAFHLLDEGTANRVNPDSLGRNITRLTRELGNLAVPKDDWAGMTNPQRLRWLLEESHTSFQVCTNGTALLSRTK